MKQLTLVLNPAIGGGSPLGDGACVCTEVIIHLHNPTLTVDNQGLIIGSVSDTIQLASGQYKFIIDYDETVLDNPSSSLGQCDVKSICCKDCVTEYVDKRLAQVTGSTFDVEADFGEDITIAPNETLVVKGDGGAQTRITGENELTIEVLASGEDDNILTFGTDGRLYVPRPFYGFSADSGTAEELISGETLAIVGSGGAETSVASGAITVDVSPSAQVGNVLTYGSDGKLYVPAAEGGAFIVDADSGSPQSISSGNTLNILGSGGAVTSVGATDTVTVDVSPSLDAANALTLGTDGKLYVAAAVSGSFLVAGDAGSNQTISSGDTLSIIGDDGIETEASATDTLIVRWSPSVAGNFGSGYAVTGLSVANGVITLNSAREHTSELFSGDSTNNTTVNISAVGTYDTAGYVLSITNPSAHRSMNVMLNISSYFQVALRNAGAFIFALRVNALTQSPTLYWNTNGASSTPPTASTVEGSVLLNNTYTLTVGPGATTNLTLVQRITNNDDTVAGSNVYSRSLVVRGIGFTV